MNELKRNPDGTIKNISDMGDFVKKEPLSKKEAERQEKLKKLKEKYDKNK